MNKGYISMTLTVTGLSEFISKGNLAKELESDKGMQNKSASVRIRRIPSSYADGIKSAEMSIRNLFYSKGVQVGDAFLFPFDVLPSVNNELDKKRQAYSLAVDFLARAAGDGSLREQCKAMMGTEYTENLVPTESEVRGAYGVIVEPYADLNDPTIKQAIELMGEGVAEAMKKDIQATIEKRENGLKVEFAKKIVESVINILNDLEDACATEGKGKHFKTLVDKVGYIVNTLPSYNVHGDAEVNKLIATVNEKLGQVKEYSLREDDTVRSTVKGEVSSIKNGFANLFKGIETKREKVAKREVVKKEVTEKAIISFAPVAPAPEVVPEVKDEVIEQVAQKAQPKAKAKAKAKKVVKKNVKKS